MKITIYLQKEVIELEIQSHKVTESGILICVEIGRIGYNSRSYLFKEYLYFIVTS